MAHDKVYGFCENKCKVEVPTKNEIPGLATDTTAGIMKLFNQLGENTDGAVTPSAVLSVANLNIWEKKWKTADAGYTLCDSEQVQLYYPYEETWYVSDSVEVSSDGICSLSSPTSVSVNNSSTASNLLGKYASKSNTPSASYPIYFFQTGQTLHSYRYDGNKVLGYSEKFSVEYVTSMDKNAYPESGTVDGVTYIYKGTMKEPGAKIETGSYTGTGTYGSSRQNSLTFGFEPKLVMIGCQNASYAYQRAFLTRVSTYAYVGNSSQDTNTNVVGPQIHITWSGNNVSWYGTNAAYQLNASGYAYNYIAIG